MDPLTIIALLAQLARLGGAVAGAYATAAAGGNLTDDQKKAIDAASALLDQVQDQAIADAIARAAGHGTPIVVPGPSQRFARADDTVDRARPRKLSELTRQPDDLGGADPNA